MNIFEHPYKAHDILNTCTINDTDDTTILSYDYKGKYFTINMRYFWDGGRFYGFVNFYERNNDIDTDSAYLVGHIVERYINRLSDSEFPNVTVVFYTADNIPEYHNIATTGFNHILFFNTRTDIKSNKYMFYIVSNYNNIKKTWTTEQLINFLDTEL